MSVISIPIPQGPVARTQAGEDLLMTREWYKYLGQLVQALGNSTTYVPDTVAANTFTPNLSAITTSIAEIRTLALLGDPVARSRLEEVLRYVKTLEALVLSVRPPVPTPSSIGALGTTLANGKIWVGNASNVAAPVTPTGDVTFTNAGVTAIGTAKVTNAMLADMAAWTIKLRNAGSTGVPSNAASADISTKTTPVVGDYVIGFDSTGAIKKYDVGTLPASGGVGGSSSDLATEILADAPTGYWKCDETGGSTITDYSGNAYHMTVVGTPTLAHTYLIPNDATKYLRIKSTTDGASITSGLGASFPLTGDWTIEACMSPEVVGGTQSVMFVLGGGGELEADNVQALMGLSATAATGLRTLWESGAGTDRETVQPGGVQYAQHDPKHFVVVKDGTANTVTFWKNGRKLGVGAVAYTNEPTGGSGTMRAAIGHDGTGFQTQLMTIGHVAFYNGLKLSDARIRAHAMAAGLQGG